MLRKDVYTAKQEAIALLLGCAKCGTGGIGMGWDVILLKQDRTYHVLLYYSGVWPCSVFLRDSQQTRDEALLY